MDSDLFLQQLRDLRLEDGRAYIQAHAAELEDHAAFGNLLAILFGVADAERTRHILRYLRQVGADEPFPVKAIYPPIFPGDKEWRDYYRSRNLNLPHHYHNGGIWPFIGGFYVATLVHTGFYPMAQYLIALCCGQRGPAGGE